MTYLRFSEKIRSLFAVLLLTSAQWLESDAKLSVCSKAKEGNQTLYRKISGDDGVVICIKHNGNYEWKSLDGSSTLGEHFNPANDCSDIVDNLPGAKDGFYWIKPNKAKPSKAWCDTHTDGGGFLLIGMTNNPKKWNVPSNGRPVNPLGPPHWSSEFGDVTIQDLAIQISTTKNFKDTKAHWSYRLKTSRALGNLFAVDSGGCTDIHSGIGNISYVKDILTETVVTTNLSCPKFGPHQSVSLGWGRMNYCLRNKCPNGYAFIKGIPIKLDNHGSFSYSVSSRFSGITHKATAFVGCDAGKCCACFGPKGGRGHYCSKKCQPVNGGTVLTGQAYVWYWIRTRMPKRVWKRCVEFKMKTAAGKFETYYVDRNTGTAHKGTCSEQFETFLNEGTLLVKNKESFNNLPPVEGMLTYREDNEKLYVKKGNKWDEIGSENETEVLSNEVEELKVNLLNKDSQQDVRIRNLETNITAKLENLVSKISQQDTQLKSIVSEKLKSLEDKLNKSETKLNSIARKSCKDILAANKFSSSGIYWIQPVPGTLFKVYCDMETHGGGWTLVYSYTFTNYNGFYTGSNAVTPRPNWPASDANVPISTTPPLRESSRGAVDWNIWKNIGKEFMIKSNINDWIVCQPNGGSLVTKTNGGVSCQNIKNVATACSGVTPYTINWYSPGPFLTASWLFYYFDGSTIISQWPVHDPCGTAGPNQKKGVSNPGGQIYLR